MSRDSHDTTHGSWSKRRALFDLSNLSTDEHKVEEKASKMLKKHRKRPSLLTDISNGDSNDNRSPSSEHTKPPRPSLSMKSRRPPSVFSSLRGSIRSHAEKDDTTTEPLSAASTTAPSFSFGDTLTDTPTNRAILIHGEVQTSAGMFRKKKEYLVLTENAMTRYKSQAKAAETYSAIPAKSNNIRHGQMPSYGSSGDLQTVSDSSGGDKTGRIPLNQIVAVQTLDDGKPYFTIEVSYLDEDSGQAASITLQFGNPQERDTWIQSIRLAVGDARLKAGQHISNYNLEHVARIVERDNDYDPDNCIIYKVVQRHTGSKSSSRSSSDDLSKVASTVNFLAIGVHKIHLIPSARPVSRGSSPSLASAGSAATTSYGVLTMASLKVSDFDDSFELTIRRPLQRPLTLYLASSSSHEIAARLYFAENYLRPAGGHRFYRLTAPAEVDDILPPSVAADAEEHDCLQRTLIAYCVAYGVNPSTIRYSINYDCEDAPRFELLPAAHERRQDYTPLELLAVMRTLRYNETFCSISLANIPLDGLNGLHDNYGREYVCTRTKNGTMIKMTHDELAQSCLLKQEVRALAVTNRKLRRLDFSHCINVIARTPSRLLVEDGADIASDPGCGIVEALLPLCQHQTTNVDWICLNGIALSDTDLDYLVGAAVDKACHFRAIELNRCALNDRSLGLILDALRAQDNTLEAIELAGNTARIEPSAFDSQLSIFGFIRKLDLSNVSRTSGPEALLQAETLTIWRLSELRLSGTALNAASVEAIAAYLRHPRSQSLHELYLDNTQLSGSDAAVILQSMIQESGTVRSMHLDVSANNVGKDIEHLTHAISCSLTPSHLSMRAVEYREESLFRKMLAAWAVNKTTQYLDISQTALPGDASMDSCRALGRLIATNDTIIELNISGEDSRLASSMFGAGINEALTGLNSNTTLRVLRVERQQLGLHGASTLAQSLRSNHTLQELHCDHNDIPLQGLTDLVNSLIENTSLVYLPTMDDGRAAAFRSAETTMKSMKLEVPSARMASSPRVQTPTVAHSPVKRGLASVRKTAQRTASAYTPSFPALQSYSNSVLPTLPPQVNLTLPSKTRHVSEGANSAGFTVQDIQTTHRLLNEQWDRQCYRLAKYLERNWCLLNAIPVAMEVEDEKFERPESAGSLAKMLEQVKFDTTPRAEKDVYFDSVEQRSTSISTVAGEKPPSSFKQFILESGPSSPLTDEEDMSSKQLKPPPLPTGYLQSSTADCRTPTQTTFPV